MTGRTLLRVAVTLGTIALIAYFVIAEGTVGALRSVEAGTLAWMLAASTLVLVLRGTQLANVAAPFGVRVGLGESVGLSAMHTLSNYLPGRAGILIRGAYLRELHGLSVPDYAAMTAMWLAGSLLSAVVVGFATAATGALPVGGGRVALTLGLAGIGLVAGYLALEWAASRSVGRGRAARAVRRLHAGLAIWRRPGRWRLWFAAWSVALLLASGLRFWFTLGAVSDGPSLPAAVVVQCIVSLSLLVSVTPGNIGVREGITVFAATLAGVDADVALLASILDRAVILLPSIGGFVLLGRPLAVKLRTEGELGTSAPGR